MASRPTVATAASGRLLRQQRVPVLGWVCLSCILVLLTFRILPARTVLIAHCVAMPLYLTWALKDPASFTCAVGVSLAFVQVEPAPFDILVPVLLLAGLVRGNFRLRFTAGQALIIAAALWGILSLPWWMDVERGARFLGITVYLSALAVLLSGSTTPVMLQALVRGYLIAAVAAVCVALLSLFWHSEYAAHLLYKTPILLHHPLAYRLQAFFKDPNVFGAFLVPAIVIWASRTASGMRRSTRGAVIPACALIICCLGLVLSYSRGAILNACCALVAYLLYLLATRSSIAPRLVAAMALAGAALCVFVSAWGLWPALAVRYQFQGYDSQRILVQKDALVAFAGGSAAPSSKPSSDSPAESSNAESSNASSEHTAAPSPPSPSNKPASTTQTPPAPSSASRPSPPVQLAPHPPAKTVDEGADSAALPTPQTWVQRFLLGLGPGQFEARYVRSSHNLYIRLVTEGGIPALALFLTGLTLMLAGSLRGVKARAWDSPTVVLGVIVAGIMAQGMTIDTLHWRHFWVFLGALPLAIRRPGHGESCTVSRTPSSRGIAGCQPRV